MYRHGQRSENKRRRTTRRLIALLLFLAIATYGTFYILDRLKPQTSLQQAAPVIKKVSYDEKTNTIKYDEADFTIELPVNWQKKPRPVSQYQSFTWAHIDKTKTSEEITVYQDIIPLKYAVNRVLIVEPGLGTVTIRGKVSDNCSTYTKNVSTERYQAGTPAKWEGIDFLCDQGNTLRDVIGTSSVNGVNIVTVTSPTKGVSKNYFFTYRNHSIKPDYTVFTNAVSSFKMK